MKTGLVIIKINGGLGNQFFQYAFAKRLSKDLNYKLVLDLQYFKKNSFRKYRLDHFNVKYTFKIEHVASFFLKCNFKTTLSDYKEWWKFLNYDLGILRKQRVIQLDGCWCNAEYFNSIRNELIHDFALADEDGVGIQDMKSKILRENSVGLHIRRTDYLNSLEAAQIFSSQPVVYYQKAITFVKERLDSPVFFIFSDDITWVKENMPFNTENIVYVSDNQLKDYEEFELLRSCKHHIIANSTFSWWAAYVNTNLDPNKIIIQPKQWYLHEQAQKAYSANQLIGQIGILL